MQFTSSIHRQNGQKQYSSNLYRYTKHRAHLLEEISGLDHRPSLTEDPGHVERSGASAPHRSEAYTLLN